MLNVRNFKIRCEILNIELQDLVNLLMPSLKKKMRMNDTITGSPPKNSLFGYVDICLLITCNQHLKTQFQQFPFFCLNSNLWGKVATFLKHSLETFIQAFLQSFQNLHYTSATHQIICHLHRLLAVRFHWKALQFYIAALLPQNTQRFLAKTSSKVRAITNDPFCP